MSSPERLTISRILSLVSSDGVYFLTYAFAFGMSVWITFFAGIIAHRALPRQQFAALQMQVFPVYFRASTTSLIVILLLWTFSHPDVLSGFYDPRIADVAQAWSLVSVLLTQATNRWFVGPATIKTMFERERLEKAEGKNYNAEGVSEEMKALNKRFGSLHGASSLLNMTSVIALGFHGLWIGNFGLRGY